MCCPPRPSALPWCLTPLRTHGWRWGEKLQGDRREARLLQVAKLRRRQEHGQERDTCSAGTVSSSAHSAQLLCHVLGRVTPGRMPYSPPTLRTSPVLPIPQGTVRSLWVRLCPRDTAVVPATGSAERGYVLQPGATGHTRVPQQTPSTPVLRLCIIKLTGLPRPSREGYRCF
jgi:hypothetical protein